MKTDIRLFAGAGVLALLTSCASFTNRLPSSVAPLNSIAQGLADSAENFRTKPVNTETCQGLLDDVNGKVSAMIWDGFSNSDLHLGGPEILQKLWLLRLQMHSHLSGMSKSCVLQVRDLFHRMRDQEDYLGEFVYHAAALDPSKLDFQAQAVPIYDRKAYPPYLVRPDLDDSKFAFHSGDLMLARGISFFSAIISQVSDNKSEFSHVVFVNEDAKSKKLNTVESYIGSGVATYEMNFALKNENARLLVLRPKDEALGARAAGYAMTAAAERIQYDYNMDFSNYSRMSWVEVARACYDQASRGSMMIPEIPANLNLKSTDFLEQMGLKNGSLITPDDLEVDPRFELVLDWRDYRLIRDSRHKDAILNELVRWINDLGYKFHDTTKSFVAKNIILPSRSTRLWPLVRKVTGSPDMDPAFPKKTLGMMVVLNQISATILGQVEQLDTAYMAQHGRPMTNAQLREAVNNLRTEDLIRYKKGQRTSIHYALRPDGSHRW